jgi:V/A-type H+-transporting ATPase subunit C
MLELAKYSFVNAKIRVMLSRLISVEVFQRLMDAKDISEVMEGLKKTSYAPIIKEYSQNDDLKALEKMFCLNDVMIYRKVYDALNSTQEKEFVFLLMSRYEMEELKLVLRAWHNKLAIDLNDYLLNEKITFTMDYKKIMSARTIEEVILFLHETPYMAPLIRVRDTYIEKKSSFYLEAALDLDYYARLNTVISKFSTLDKHVALRILGIEIDIENINWLIRLRKYYSLGMADLLTWVIPGGFRIDKDTVRGFYTTNGVTKVVESISRGPYAKLKDLMSENASLIENFLYEILLREVNRSLAGFPFTIGTILGYCILKHQETRNVISLLYAKNYGFTKESVSPLLRMR